MYRKLIARNNLLLAWRRITTSGNFQYKRFYRNLYSVYEVALQDNIHLLHRRLKAHRFKANLPIKIYIPKPSGLQRPITLLYLEDQIVLQAFANILAERLREKRKLVEKKCVFSNFLNTHDSIFFVWPWRISYRQYQNALTIEYQNGYKWVAHFDLASFYDTVSHDLLLRQLAPRSVTSDVWKFLQECLSIWTSCQKNRAYGHGIPQGPSASDILAELFLLSIDLEMIQRGHKYYRYVDDIRLFGKNTSEVRRATIDLDFLCREVGLVPQSSKHSIIHATKLSDVFGALPSLHDLDSINQTDNVKILEEAEKLFVSSLDNTTKDIVDKSLAKYVLYRAHKSNLILSNVLRLLPRQPEYIDAFISFLNQYCDSIRVKQLCQRLLFERFPYDYVNGELWRLLALAIRNRSMPLIKLAVNTSKDANRCFSARLGALIFLSECDRVGMGNYSNFFKYAEPSLLQAIGVAYIPSSKLIASPMIMQLLTRSSFEVSMAISHAFILNNVNLSLIIKNLNKLPIQTQNVLRVLTGTSAKKSGVEFINEILMSRYRIPSWTGWKVLLGSQYGHALGLLRTADPVFASNRSEWLSHMDSFNDTLYRALQDFLRRNSASGQMATSNLTNGKLIDFGILIHRNTPFASVYPDLAINFDTVHKRRNRLPSSHPYDKNTGQKAVILKKNEQGGMVKALFIVYSETIRIAKSMGIN